MRELRTDEQQAVTGGLFFSLWHWKKPSYHKPSPPKHDHKHDHKRHGC